MSISHKNTILSLRQNVSRGIYALNMSKHVLAHRHMMLLYNSFVQPYIQYGIIFWGKAYRKQLRRSGSRIEQVSKGNYKGQVQLFYFYSYIKLYIFGN